MNKCCKLQWQEVMIIREMDWHHYLAKSIQLMTKRSHGYRYLAEKFCQEDFIKEVIWMLSERQQLIQNKIIILNKVKMDGFNLQIFC